MREKGAMGTIGYDDSGETFEYLEILIQRVGP